MRAVELAEALGVDERKFSSFRRLLSRLVRAGKLYRVKGHRYGIPQRLQLVTGVLSLTRAGDGFVHPEDDHPDVFVPSSYLDTALDGDRVVVRIEDRPEGRSPVGRVIRVLERARDSIVGTLHHGRRFNFVVPLDPRVMTDVLIPPGEDGGARDGDVVVVRIESYGEGRHGPVGVVEKVLGPLSDPGVDVLAVGYGFGVQFDFPPEVDRAARKAARRGMERQGHRKDRTDLPVVTIDPADAKDHDDALSLRPLRNGRWEVGIHIADVSHFVREGGPVDTEALSRGTSVYLVDRTVPMLPESLSADVCSLRPHEDRLAVSLFLDMDTSGQVHRCRYERTRIRSRHRLAYEQVQEVLDGRASLGDDVDRMLRTLDDIARGVRRRRLKRGALDLDLPEAKVILDTDGVPVDIRRRHRLEAHRLIEDFMILANERVARDLEAREADTLFRVHEPPPVEKVDELRELLARFGHTLPQRRTVRPRDLQKVLDAVRGRPEEDLITGALLRSLSRARYDPRNLGHFGLASRAYLHFTSPIRRYPDLVVHRQVVRTLVQRKPPVAWDPDALMWVAEHTSAREQAADEAERASVDMKKVEFMERHLGEEFDGRVSGVAQYGFFVTLDEYFVDGLVHVNSLRDDFYRLDRKAYALVGDRGRGRFRLGDRVRVRVARVDKESRHIDFLLVRTLARSSRAR